jgi:two-component system, OmpR family, response regulator BaeR
VRATLVRPRARGARSGDQAAKSPLGNGAEGVDHESRPAEGEGERAPVVLVADHDATTLSVVSDALRQEGFAVEPVSDGQRALELATRRAYELVILDPAVPGFRGVEGCRSIRAASDIPILIVSGRDSPADRVLGLEAGADDYVGKPFEMAELLSRVHAIVRRRQLDRQPVTLVQRVGEIEIDRAWRRVSVAGQPVDLTPSEFRVLTILAQAAPRPVAPAEIMRQLWQTDTVGRNASCRTHIFNLRQKLDVRSPGRERIVTVPGVGYRLAAAADGVHEPERHAD